MFLFNAGKPAGRITVPTTGDYHPTIGGPCPMEGYCTVIRTTCCWLAVRSLTM